MATSSAQPRLLDRRLLYAEAAACLHLVLPSALREAAEMLPWVASLAFVGRVSTDALAAVSLGESFMWCSAAVVWEGIGATLSTLASQAHGAGSSRVAQRWLVLSLVNVLLLSLPVLVLWLMMETILLKLGFDAAICAGAQLFATACIGNLFLHGFVQQLGVYFTSTQRPVLPFAIHAATAVVDITGTYILVLGAGSWPGLGIFGSAMGWLTAEVFGSMLYIVVAPRAEKRYAAAMQAAAARTLAITSQEQPATATALAPNPFSKPDDVDVESLTIPFLRDADDSVSAKTPGKSINDDDSSSPVQPCRAESKLPVSGDVDVEAEAQTLLDGANAVSPATLSVPWWSDKPRWRIFWKQAGPNMLTAGLETWQLQVMSLIAAALGPADIATHNAVMSLFEFGMVVLYAAGEATAARVGYHLGRGDTTSAKRAALVCLAGATTAGVLVSVVVIGAREYVGRLFSDDPVVISLAAQLMTYAGGGYALLAAGLTALCVLEAQGRATITAVIFFVGAWMISVPLAFATWRLTSFGLSGLWLAMVTGYGVICVAAGIAVCCSDWQQLAQDAADRSVESHDSDGATAKGATA